MARPSFINTKSERYAYLDQSALLDWYEDIYAGKYKVTGDGLPEDMPEGYIFRALFRYGAVQIKDTSIGRIVCAVSGFKRNVYGYPIEGTPILHNYTDNGATDVMDPSDMPIFALQQAPAEKIGRYCLMMERALRVLDQNVVALSQPVIIQGTQGGEINALTLKGTIEGADEVCIPCLDKVATQAQVLDLNAQDHTQNLLGVINAMDAKCLAGLGVKGSGADKASGITTTETEYVAQQLEMTTYNELNALNQWAEKVNAALGTCIRFELGEGYTVSTDDDPAGMQTTEDEGKQKEEA